jgi:hypothetical protein
MGEDRENFGREGGLIHCGHRVNLLAPERCVAEFRTFAGAGR